ncbi:hypothetical protein [Fluviicola sp.]|uniref:hypothetical protein n=1 Tax=Fluviicola sp. TaxID=1917219 RepID=UPI00262324A5|nr:hypothetical protein [Fluviicola sp.]
MESQIIMENVQLKEGTFYYELREKSKFDVGLYNQFIYLLINSIDSIDDETMRCKLSLQMWELFFLISKSLIHHQNKFDIYKIKGIDNELISKIVNDMYEIGNLISWKKEINSNDYFVG